MQVEIMFDCILIGFQHYISHIKHVISCEVSCLNDLLRNQISMNRDIGDSCSIFQSLNTRNLLSTEVRYNYPVSPYPLLLEFGCHLGREKDRVWPTCLSLKMCFSPDCADKGKSLFFPKQWIIQEARLLLWPPLVGTDGKQKTIL